jgi:hypothetical protein
MFTEVRIEDPADFLTGLDRPARGHVELLAEKTCRSFHSLEGESTRGELERSPKIWERPAFGGTRGSAACLG